jgi:hypothetical protein
VIDLLFWFLVSQTLTGLPGMSPGTEVKIVAPELVPVLATGRVEDSQLRFDVILEANREIRLIIIPPNNDAQTQDEAASQALYGRISPDSTDILLQFEGLEGLLSFRKWLEEERGIHLQLGPPDRRETEDR